MAKATSDPKAEQNLRTIEERWTKALTDAGWTAIPQVFLTHQRRLGLDPLDLNILLQLAKHWWDPGNPPFPSTATSRGFRGATRTAAAGRTCTASTA
jgi:hypothetical protein